MSGEENPFVEGADGEDVELIYCWRDTARACSADCVAFDDRSFEDGRYSACVLLNVKRANAKSLATIGAQLKRQNDAYEKSAVGTSGKREAEEYAEKLRELDKPPPEV